MHLGKSNPKYIYTRIGEGGGGNWRKHLRRETWGYWYMTDLSLINTLKELTIERIEC